MVPTKVLNLCTYCLLSTWSIITVSAFLADKTYPSFCSAPHDNAERSIPPLADDPFFTNAGIGIVLAHVTVITSEGIKVPSAMHKCWPTYDIKPADTSSWDCNLSTLTTAPSWKSIDYLNLGLQYGDENSDPMIGEQATVLAGENPMFLFEKRYDANYSPSGSDHFPDILGNELQGSCQVGQLTLRGYEQHKQNGFHLRNAYVKSDLDALNVDKDADKVLYDFDVESSKSQFTQRAYDEPQLYFRSDDTQATIMSGQALLQGLFGELMKDHALLSNGKRNAVIRVHTSDHKNDFMEPNPVMCPRLDQILQKSLKSEVYYIDFLHSNEALLMKEMADEFMGGWDRHEDPNIAMECIMTSICSDKTIPYVLNAEDSANDESLTKRFGDDWGNRYSKFHSRRKSYTYTFSKSRYSKIASNPVWNDVLSGLLSFMDINDYTLAEEWPDLRPPSKLSLYSAHDTTLMALLTSLGPLVFNPAENPPYASMFVIELYELDIPEDLDSQTKQLYPSSMAFRLIYNGEVKTTQISGCPPTREICDVDILILHVLEFSDISRFGEMCTVQPEEEIPEINVEPEKTHNSNRGLKAFEFVSTGLVCAGAGALAMFFYMKKSIHGTTEAEQSSLQAVDDNSNEQYQANSSIYEIAQTSPTATII